MSYMKFYVIDITIIYFLNVTPKYDKIMTFYNIYIQSFQSEFIFLFIRIHI